MLSPLAQQKQKQRASVDRPSIQSHYDSTLQGVVSADQHRLPYRNTNSCQDDTRSGYSSIAPSSVTASYQYEQNNYNTVPFGEHIPSEQLLRRKTPNGTFVAAYDGRLQEYSTGLPANKISRPARSADGYDDPSWQRRATTYQLAKNQMYNQGMHGWLHLPPLSASPYSWHGNGRIPTVLQPMWQPDAGPTASDPAQNFGPYWPDGSYSPYKPACVSDLGSNRPGYHEGSLNQHVVVDREFGMAQASLTRNGMAVGGSRETHDLEAASSTSMMSFQYPAQRIEVTPSVSSSSFHRQQHYDDTRNAQLCMNGYWKGPIYQFRDRTLAWAQRIYLDLLSSLHNSDRYLQHTGRKNDQERAHLQPDGYPTARTGQVQHARRHSLENSHTNIATFLDTSGHNLYRRYSHTLGPSQQQQQQQQQQQSPAYNLANVPKHGIQNNRHVTVEKGQVADVNNAREFARQQAQTALEMLDNICQGSQWSWIDGILLGGCLAYGLEKFDMALKWYSRILLLDPSHVEAMSNLAATLLALNRREEAEYNWRQAVHLKPGYFEAVEHLVGLLCADGRPTEAVELIEFVENSLRLCNMSDVPERAYGSPSDEDGVSSHSSNCTPGSEATAFEFDLAGSFNPQPLLLDISCNRPGYGSSGYKIPDSENGRILALVHGKGNLLYGLGDVKGASRSFEDAVLISTGRRHNGIRALIDKILRVVSAVDDAASTHAASAASPHEGGRPILLSPDHALKTASLVFGPHGELPGLKSIPEGMARKAALSTTSNALLSLAKIFQDSLSSNTLSGSQGSKPPGIGEILGLYYLSLSLHPSPSTANNVGILLASVQQPASQKATLKTTTSLPAIPGVTPGSGVALALAYYNYGLNLDSRHTHLFTNLGSLLKDIGQLVAAIKMYEQAVACDGTFDIALANLANAVKDQGRISEAITFYRRAVASNPNFAEAVCGLANALNSVCEWTGRGGVIFEQGKYDRWHVDDQGMLYDSREKKAASGWINRVVDIVTKQLNEGTNWGRGVLRESVVESLITQLSVTDTGSAWSLEKSQKMREMLSSWAGRDWEGARIVRLIERATRQTMHRWYLDRYVHGRELTPSKYLRPVVPDPLSTPTAPTVLPFHTFTCPLGPRDIRMISQRNALRISCSALRAAWLPRSVYSPPAPPAPYLKIGYVSSDFNNHPLSHLMQSVFGFHDTSRVRAFCYATTPSDKSIHRQKIEKEAPSFYDASSWSAERLIDQILKDGIHILVNLNGYTRGARNEIFAARPVPIQMSFMGFAGSLGAEWCDYLLADEIAIPRETLRPSRSVRWLEDPLPEHDVAAQGEWIYSESVIFCKDTFFCCDHRQSSNDAQVSWEEEEQRRWHMRKELFPNLPDSAVVLGNFNQLYKIDPTTFRTWLRILAKVPNAILWLLRFPDLGESNLKKTAKAWAGEDVASRIWFTDVAPKGQHISRARICDLFLDTPECNAHTTAADVLWSSTPLLTLPRYKYKMCSRMAASILTGALPKTKLGRLAAEELIVNDEEEYEQCAIELASGLRYSSDGKGSGRLIEVRKLLYESRQTSALFDTQRWVRDLERAYEIAWSRWVEGKVEDIFL